MLENIQQRAEQNSRPTFSPAIKVYRITDDTVVMPISPALA